MEKVRESAEKVQRKSLEYTNKKGRWQLGGQAATELWFNCTKGGILNPRRHGDAMPHRARGCWECFDKESERFIKDYPVVIITLWE